jgi:hypothetical protein
MRSLFRLAIVLGAGAASALVFRLPGARGIEAALLPAVLPLAAVLWVVADNRAQARKRWQSAWDAYIESDSQREPVAGWNSDAAFALSGAR